MTIIGTVELVLKDFYYSLIVLFNMSVDIQINRWVKAEHMGHDNI